MNGTDWVDEFLRESVSAAQGLASAELRAVMTAMAGRITAALQSGNKLLIAGNGGSAGDSAHIAAEFVSRFLFNRLPLAAIALTTDTSVLTAIGNDYGFANVFERQVRALGKPGDVFLGISTSGRSPNILGAIAAARAGGMTTLAFCGALPAGMAEADLVLPAPSTRTAIIQQTYLTAAHVICAMVEQAMFPEQAAAFIH